MRHLVIINGDKKADVRLVDTKQQARALAKQITESGKVALVVGAVGLERFEQGVRVPADWSMLPQGYKAIPQVQTKANKAK